MNISRRVFIASIPLLGATRLLSEEERPAAAGSRPVRETMLFAAVRDKSGHLVRDLKQEDFELSEEGSPLAISSFSRNSSLPLTAGLLVETSRGQKKALPAEREASRALLQKLLRDDRDAVFVIHFDVEVELLADVTASRAKLERALDELEATSRLPSSLDGASGDSRPPQRGSQGGSGGSQGGSGGTWGTGGGWPGSGGGLGTGGTSGGGRRGGTGGNPGGNHPPARDRVTHTGGCLHDAILLASDELMAKRSGCKALIVLTTGLDSGSKMTLSSAIEAAQRGDTLLYPILVESDDNRGKNPQTGARGTLDRLVRECGGRSFEVTKKQPLKDVFGQIQEELASLYSFAYVPGPGAAGTSRTIRLTTTRKDLTVSARTAYYTR